MLIPVFRPAARKASFGRSQFLLGNTIDNLFRHYPVSKALFITVTFPEAVTSPAEAHRRLNSFLNKIRTRYRIYIWVLGCHDSAALHYHILVFVSFDCHTDTDLTAWSNPVNDHLAKRDAEQHNAMNPALRAESDWWEETAPRFGFGRVQVAPVYSNPEAVRKYLLKQAPGACQIALGIVKNVRFWSCSRDMKSGTSKFAWNTRGGRLQRDRLQQWANEHGCNTYEELRQKIGPDWGYRFICDTAK